MIRFPSCARALVATLRDLPVIALFALFILLLWAGWLVLPLAGWFWLRWWGVLLGLLVWWVIISATHAVGYFDK